jgi:hypothetical protein
MTAVTRAADAMTDTRIMVFDADKDELIAANDRSLANLNSIVQFDVVENRRYYVVVQGEAGTTGDYWLTLRTSFSAKEKAFASLSSDPSARKIARPLGPAAIAASVPTASFAPPQWLPAKGPASPWRGVAGFSAWRS